MYEARNYNNFTELMNKYWIQINMTEHRNIQK